jgi:phosphomannomutase
MAEFPLIISVSGLRGVVGEGLTPPRMALFAAMGARDLAQQAAQGGMESTAPFVVARDSRPHGAMLVQAAAAGIRATGHSVVDAGIAATPTVGVLVRQLGASGAVQVTASHNPPQWNGAKLFTHEGRVLGGADAESLAERFRAALRHDEAQAEKRDPWANWQHVGGQTAHPDPHQPHLDAILRHVDPSRIAARALHVVLDANHGAGGILATRLLERLGCRVTGLGIEPDGRFAHPPEPLEENLSQLCAEVLRCRADVGFALDPDADRLAVVDESGRYLGEENTLALVVDQVLPQRPGPVVTNVSTTRAIDDLAGRHACPVYRTKVGEANVVDGMLAQQAVIGGEGNGGVIDPRVGLVRDAFVGIAWILDSLAEPAQTLGSRMQHLPRYHMVKHKLALDARSSAEIEKSLAGAFDDAEIDRTDGLHFGWANRWFHVRASNTEPVVRVIAEAPDAAQAEDLARKVRQRLEQHAKRS